MYKIHKLQVLTIVVILFICSALSVHAIEAVKGIQRRPDLNGKLLQQKSTDSVYWIDQGFRRRIEHVDTLSRIFIEANVEQYQDILFIIIKF